MKITPVLFVLLLTAVISSLSCKKDTQGPPQVTPAERKVRFVLYTSKDFSGDNHTITFTLHITDPSNNPTVNPGGRAIWDSVLAPMAIKDIPALGNKLVFEKTIPNTSKSDLSVGFLYTITDVGMSWHLDILKTADTLKTVDYDFQ